MNAPLKNLNVCPNVIFFTCFFFCFCARHLCVLSVLQSINFLKCILMPLIKDTPTSFIFCFCIPMHRCESGVAYFYSGQYKIILQKKQPKNLLQKFFFFFFNRKVILKFFKAKNQPFLEIGSLQSLFFWNLRKD